MNASLTNKQSTKEWFDGLVNNVRYDQLLYESEVMPDDKKKVIDGLMKNDFNPMFEQIRQASSAFYIQSILKSYFVELAKSKRRPNKIALELSDSKILVWAEVKADDEEMEDVLILSEAKVNAEFSQHGFNISSTIVDESDSLDVPSHYKIVSIN